MVALIVDLHLGKRARAYAQIGPMIRVPDSGTDTEVGVSGKAGYSFGPGYSELSFTSIDSDTCGSTSKLANPLTF